MPTDLPRIPLTRWADAQLATLAAAFEIALPEAATLLGERARLNGFNVPDAVSAGGGCRMFRAVDDSIALNLSRPEDVETLPALFGVDHCELDEVNGHIAKRNAAEVVARGRLLGMAIAHVSETVASPATTFTQTGPSRPLKRRPLVIDLSALWAGPLAAHLLWLGGADVVKVESRSRPDSMRQGDPALFDLLNQGKANIALNLRDAAERDALIGLIRKADFVIEAARPRALLQLGIDANALVCENPGLVWMTITGHGAEGEAANWVGFGDDTAVAGGLSAALYEATGTIGFVGDAIGDPLTGIFTAKAAWEQRASGMAARIIVSMSGIVAKALAYEKMSDPEGLKWALKQWVANVGGPFPETIARKSEAAAALGADNSEWLF